MKLNLNARVRARLTISGMAALERYGYTTPQVLALNGVWEGQLWEVAAIFGDGLYNGSTRLPFQKNELILVQPRHCAAHPMSVVECQECESARTASDAEQPPPIEFEPLPPPNEVRVWHSRPDSDRFVPDDS